MALAQQDLPPYHVGAQDSSQLRLPNGKLQRDEIVRAEDKQNLKDAQEMARLSAEIKADMEKGDGHVLSLKTLKQLDDLEKLAKNIRARLKHN